MRSRPIARQAGFKRLRRGAAAVEFAVVAPMFFLLLAGIIEFGQAFRIQHALSTASRRGARASIVNSASNKQVQENVKTYCQQILGVKKGEAAVEISVNGVVGAELSKAQQGDEIRVNVSVSYSKAGAGFYANMFSTSDLSAACTLEHE